jgi:hypothetical protein
MNEAIRSFSVEGNSTAQLFLLSATPLKKLAKPWTMPAGCIWSKGAARPCVQTDSMHISPGRLLCALEQLVIGHSLVPACCFNFSWPDPSTSSIISGQLPGVVSDRSHHH